MMAHPQDSTTPAVHPTRSHHEYPNVIEVLCGDEHGYHICHRAIAWIVQDDEQRPGEPPERYLVALPWFYPDREGVFYEPKHAAENRRYGRAPSQRRPVRPSLVGRDQVLLWPLCPSSRVRCPGCDTVYLPGAGAGVSEGVSLAILMRLERSVDK